jgi:hypothetical protein
MRVEPPLIIQLSSFILQLLNLLFDRKAAPIIAGKIRLMNQIVVVVITIPNAFTLNAPTIHKESCPLMPRSASAIAGIKAIERKTKATVINDIESVSDTPKN